MIKKWLWIFLLVALFLTLAHDRLIGLFLEPYLGKQLTELFGMPVKISGLRVKPLSGKIKATRLTFTNQPEFAPGPHIDIQDLEADIDFRALANHQILIGTIHTKQPYYFIDRIATDEGPRNNVVTWYRHIKSKTRKNDPADDPKSKASAGDKASQLERRWWLSIKQVNLRNGTFIFHDRSGKDPEKKFVFEKLNGFLTDLEWPNPNPSILHQKVELRGTFGEFYPAPFKIDGRANFITKRVSFDLNGRIDEGFVMEHRRLWEGSSIRILDGKFQLESRTLCLKHELQSRNRLVLKSLRLAPGPSATDKIWGLPMAAAMGFLQNQETIHLNVSVHGNIGDPKFEFGRAFRAALQNALAQRTKSSLNLITEGTTKLASHTKDIIQETPTRLVSSLEKIVKKTE